MTGGGIHASASAIESVESSYLKFVRTVRGVLDSTKRELSRVRESLAERRRSLRREIESLEDEISSAGEDEDTSYAYRRLEEARDELDEVRRQSRRLEEAASTYLASASTIEHRQSEDPPFARAYLQGAAEALRAYRRLDGYPGGVSSGPMALTVNSVPGVPEVRRAIREASFTSARRLAKSDAGINESWKLTNGVQVIFKPALDRVVVTGIPPRGEAIREKAVSIVDELLGLQLVPPTDTITYGARKGSAQLWKGEYETAYRAIETGTLDSHNYLDALTERQRQDWQLLDALVGNVDRHFNNWLVRRTSDGRFELALIDNGRSFLDNGQAPLIIHPSSSESLDSVSRARLVNFLGREAEWRNDLSAMVGDKALGHMLDRAHGMLSTGKWPSPDVGA